MFKKKNLTQIIVHEENIITLITFSMLFNINESINIATIFILTR